MPNQATNIKWMLWQLYSLHLKLTNDAYGALRNASQTGDGNTLRNVRYLCVIPLFGGIIAFPTPPPQ